MSKLKTARELKNLTQEELSEKSKYLSEPFSVLKQEPNLKVIH